MLSSAATTDRQLKGLYRRGHDMGRKARWDALVSGMVSDAEAFDFWRKHDAVTLTTPEENSDNGSAHWSEVIPLPVELFGWHTGYGVSMTERRKAYLCDFLERL